MSRARVVSCTALYIYQAGRLRRLYHALYKAINVAAWKGVEVGNTLYNKANARGGLTFQEKAVLLQLAYVARDDLIASVSVSTLAAMACCTERTAQRNVHKLVKLGVLTPIGEGGGRNIQAYKIDVDDLPIIVKKKPVRRARRIQNVADMPIEEYTMPEKQEGETLREYQARLKLKPRRLSDEEIAALAAGMRRL